MVLGTPRVDDGEDEEIIRFVHRRNDDRRRWEQYRAVVDQRLDAHSAFPARPIAFQVLGRTTRTNSTRTTFGHSTTTTTRRRAIAFERRR